MKRGTARSANSVHALVYGKTGTSSRNEDALFVGLTEQFVGSLWLGHDKPAPMPGVHGGGAPAKAFANLTDFYYLRLAQARFELHQQEVAGGEWGRLRSLAPSEPAVRKLAILGSMLMSCWLLALLFRRRKQQRQRLQPRRRARLWPVRDRSVPGLFGPVHRSPLRRRAGRRASQSPQARVPRR